MQNSFFPLRVQIRVTRFLFYLIVLLLVGNVSCKKKKCTSTTSACAAFSDNFFDNWFPYTVGQEIIFRSTAGGEKKISIQQRSKSVETKASTFEYECDGPSPLLLTPVPISEECPSASIASTPPTNNAIGFRIAYSPSRELMLHVDTTILIATSLHDTGIVNIRGMGRSSASSSRFHPSYVSNGTSFNKVQVITRDTTFNRTKGVYKLVLAQTIGVIEYEEYPSLIAWRKQ
jgi:hypothetical protein